MPAAPVAITRTALALLLLLLLVLLLALLGRLGSAGQLGRDWYGPGSFTLVNFDEAGSCRAALGGFSYSPLTGYQTLAIAAVLGLEPTPAMRDNYRGAKAFCHSPEHLGIARLYSALLGSLTVVLVAVLGWQLFPQQPQIGLLGAALLALSGWHISESHSGTVDAVSTFFIYLFFCVGIRAVRRGGWRWLAAAVLLVPAVWTKYWVFALCSVAVLVPAAVFTALLRGLSRARLALLLVAYAALFGLVSNPAMPELMRWLLPPVFYLLVPWRALGSAGRGLLLVLPWLAPLAMQLGPFVAYSSGGLEGRFGTDYGAIGWHKPLRNLLNPPLVLIVGLSIPGFVLALAGAARLWRQRAADRAWLVLLPLLAFALYMAFLAPVTYYRHYLPLLPAACLLAAVGACSLAAGRRWPVVAAVLLWQGLLAWDLVLDYHQDPRRELPAWFAREQPRRLLTSYYAHPPPAAAGRYSLFQPRGDRRDGQRLRAADYLLLSENWYDTAFANELNGPLVGRPERLIKTTPEAAGFYRRALAGEHPLLQRSAVFSAPTFMPELRLHKALYGSFTQFVGDIVILRVRREP